MTTELQTNTSTDEISIDTVDINESVEGMTESTEPPIKKINIGETLKLKRLELKFDERQVATELKIPIDQVRALEANKFEHFRSVTFARGFLKSYCRMLDLDFAEIIEAFDSEKEKREPTIKPVDKVHKQTNLGDPIVILISLVIVSVLVFLVFWWPSTPNDNANIQTPAEVPAAEQINGAEASDKVPEIVAPEGTPTDTPITDPSSVVTGISSETAALLESAGVKPDEVVKAAKQIGLGSDEPAKEALYTYDIEMAFSDDCWAEIRDSTDRILFSGVKTADSILELTGSAPYRVVIGYARGVSSLKYKGEEFDFSSFTRQDLARFELK